jgi:uncharacterized protein YbjT (DUF2867 family)
VTRRDVTLVTGATGNVGREVVRALTTKGMPVRVAVTDPAAASAIFGSDVDAVRFDYRDAASFAVVDGARALFLVRPPAISDVEHTLLPLIDEARRRGVSHIVFLSVAGAQNNRLVPHHAVERHLIAGTGWTVLRPGFFAQNLGDAYLRDIVDDARIHVPCGRGRIAFVDVRDIAEVAATIFADPTKHDGAAYTLTGPEAIDLATVASHLSDVLGRSIRYEPASLIAYGRHLRRRGLPWTQVVVQTLLHTGVRFGRAERVDPTLERLLGRRPRTVREYVEDHRSLWT